MSRTAMCESCATEFEAAPYGKLPKRCPACKELPVASTPKASRKPRAAAVEPTVEETPAAPAIDALAIIAQLRLDYCVGSAARFLLEVADGDELENLRTARTYLDAAISAREAA